jgi:toxin ParE1/3/4
VKVTWTEAALADRLDIFRFVASDNPKAAARLDDALERAAGRLSLFPHSGRRGRVDGTREVQAHTNYRLVYRVLAEGVFISAVLHAARQWPPETP